MKSFILSSLLLSSVAFAIPKAVELEDVSGKKAILETDKNQRLVVFWATWCTECKGKLKTILPELDKNPNVSVVTVNFDEERERAEDFVKKNDITLPVVRNPSETLKNDLEVNVLPFWAVYTRKDKSSDWELKAKASAFKLNDVKQALGI